MAVKKTLQTKRGTRSGVIGPFMFIIVVKKLAEPRILLTPAKCRLKIARSTEPPGWPLDEARGG